MADSGHVRAVSFAELLDEALGRGAGAARVPASARPAWTGAGNPSVLPFLQTRPLTAPIPRWPSPAARPRRPDHALSATERQAFNRLLDLGARLEANFSAEELRSEYRRLAQRYHPDRHTGGSVLDQQQLARLFADVTERYRCLRALVEPRH